MTALAQRFKDKYFPEEHPYRTFQREVEWYLRPGGTLLDAGCGRTAPVLTEFRQRAGRLIGVDVVDFAPGMTDVELLKHDLARLPLEAATVDLVMARSVIEHVTDPAAVFGEMYRILKPGGYFIFLTANLWCYASLIAKLVPNRWHPYIVARTEGRDEIDVFPVAYRANTRRAITTWAALAGFNITSFRYLGQYPSYFMFNGALFLIATVYEKLIRSMPPLRVLQGWLLVTLQKPKDVIVSAAGKAA